MGRCYQHSVPVAASRAGQSGAARPRQSRCSSRASTTRERASISRPTTSSSSRSRSRVSAGGSDRVPVSPS
ncbi:Atrochrysone carboxylic acid synthase, partial [Frankliniella fusca]